jgi:predicted DCC family thiol-disulfide oxidoreductase YuxK
MEISKFQGHLILFDDNCLICNKWVKFILQHDKSYEIKITSLLSPVGTEVLRINNIIEYNTIVYINNNKYFTKSDAILQIYGKIGGIYSLAIIFSLLPKNLRDFFYDILAQNRYRFNKNQRQCSIPTPELKERYLNSII